MAVRGRDNVMRELFGVPRALIGMVHVGALPGTPEAAHGLDAHNLTVCGVQSEASPALHAAKRAGHRPRQHQRPVARRRGA